MHGEREQRQGREALLDAAKVWEAWLETKSKVDAYRSTFPDLATAEQLVRQALAASRATIADLAAAAPGSSQSVRWSLDHPADLDLALEDIDELRALPTEEERRNAFRFNLYTIPEEPGAWDAFVADFRARIVREQAGDRSQPLVDVWGAQKRGLPVSPQGYDVSLPSAGSFDNQQIAEAVVDAVLKAYAERNRHFFKDSRPG